MVDVKLGPQGNVIEMRAPAGPVHSPLPPPPVTVIDEDAGVAGGAPTRELPAGGAPASGFQADAIISGGAPARAGRAFPRANFDAIPAEVPPHVSSDVREETPAAQGVAGTANGGEIAGDTGRSPAVFDSPPPLTEQPETATRDDATVSAPQAPTAPAPELLTPAPQAPEPETTAGSAEAPGRTAVPEFRPGGVPAGASWASARLARSWDLRFDPAGPGSPYAAVLSAFGGSVTVRGDGGDRVIRDAEQFRTVLSEAMFDRPPSGGIGQLPQVVRGYHSAVRARVRNSGGAALSDQEIAAQVGPYIEQGLAWNQVVTSVTSQEFWPELESFVAPALISEYFGVDLLVIDSDGRISASMSGPGSGSGPGVIVQTLDTARMPRWVGVPSADAGPRFGGLSGEQVAWAADEDMRFVGRSRRGGHFLDALATASDAVGLPLLYRGNAEALRRDLIGRIAADNGRAAWDDIRAVYARAAGDVGRPVDASLTEEERAHVVGQVIAWIRDPERGHALIGELWPRLTHRYLGLPIRVIGAGGEVTFFGDEDGVGSQAGPITVAPADENTWVGVAPVAPPRAWAAGTRPADVAGGWSEPYLGPDPTAAPAEPPLVGSGVVPAGVSAGQARWARSHHRRLVAVPVGLDGFFTAVLWAAGGGVTTREGVHVTDPAGLRAELTRRIQRPQDADLDTWRVVHAAYAAQYAARGPAGPESAGFSAGDAQALTGLVDERFDNGEALRDIVTSISDPASWPELAEEVAPFLLNWFGLGIRVHHPNGVISRYGSGQPVHLATIEAGRPGDPRQWVALPPSFTRYRPTSRLATPSQSDPLLIRLAQAIDERKHHVADTAGTDPVLDRLRQARARWLGLVARPDAAVAGPRGQVDLDSQIAQLDPAWHDAWAQAGGDRTGLDVSLAIELARVLHQTSGGIRSTSAPALPGVPAANWVAVSSTSELISAVPNDGTVILIDGSQVRVLLDTPSGLRLVEPDPDRPAAARVTPSLADLTGLALVIGNDGDTLPAEKLGDGFTPATDVVEIEGPAAGTQASPAEAISPLQQDWAGEHQARIEHVAPGANALFEAVIKAAGGHVTVGAEQITDAPALRKAVADRLRAMAAEGTLSNWPLGHAAYRFAGEQRIVEDFFFDDIERIEQPKLQAQIFDHIASGDAVRYLAGGFASPDRWPLIVDLLAPEALAVTLDRDVLVLDRDGKTERHGQAGGRPLVVARIGAGTRAKPGWAAVVPTAQDATASPLDTVIADTIAIPARSQHVGPAILSPGQQATADQLELEIRPTQTGPDSFYDAVITSAGGAYLLDHQTTIRTPGQLRHELTTLVRDRPDVLDQQTWQSVRQIADTTDDEQIRDILDNPADPHGVEIAQHLIGPYLGLELNVIDTNGAISPHGTGQPVTIATPASDRDGEPRWAALTPRIVVTPFDVRLPGLPGLPDLGDHDQPPVNRPWDPDRYKTVEPGTPTHEDPWRDSSYSKNPDGDNYCVSVTVVTRPQYWE
ncbi:MAG: hypothetical protein ACJ72W_09415 [Actinoallomurus sp.]